MAREIEEEETVELCLGLSIGSSSSFLQKKLISISTSRNIEEKDPRSVGSGVNQILEASGGDYIDPKSKREMHALRRQEARKKLEEKQQKKRNGSNGILVNNHIADDRTVLEAQEFQSRVRDRAVKEADIQSRVKNCKKSGENCRSDNADQNHNPNANPNPNFSPFPVVPMQYPLPFMPFSNGYQYPYMMPSWAPPTASSAHPNRPLGGEGLNHEKNVNVIQPIACRSFRPFEMVQNPNLSLKQMPCCDSEKNDGSTGSSSSSAVSDNQSASVQGGSSDTRSHSSHSPLEQTRTHVSPVHKLQVLAKHRTPSHQIESAQGAEETTDKPVLNKAESSSRNQPEETIPINEAVSTIKSAPPKNSLPPIHIGVDGEEDKKLKPSLPSLPPQMPCVSTTGNGPNGKTITGFLYRYSKTEVSIICVCHGSSFSPEEFVKHAGGTDISHPLRHIVVVPSAALG